MYKEAGIKDITKSTYNIGKDIAKKVGSGVKSGIEKHPKTGAALTGVAALAAGHGIGSYRGKKELGKKFNEYNQRENQAIAKQYYSMGRRSKTAELEEVKIAGFGKTLKAIALGTAATGLAAGTGYGGYQYGHKTGTIDTANVMSSAFREANERENQAIVNSFKRFNQRENKMIAQNYLKRGIQIGASYSQQKTASMEKEAIPLGMLATAGRALGKSFRSIGQAVGYGTKAVKSGRDVYKFGRAQGYNKGSSLGGAFDVARGGRDALMAGRHLKRALPAIGVTGAAGYAAS